MKLLLVGDPHATPDVLEEMDRLISYVIDVGNKEQVDYVVFLGDQTHTHSILNLNVMAIWQQAFKRIDHEGLHAVALVGNHDKGGTKNSTNNSMMFFDEDVQVIDIPQTISGILFVPYQDTPEEFIEACKKSPTKTVICHQSFDGSHYENGFLIEGAVDPLDVPQDHIISGHIHSPQSNGKVTFPGAPRWRSVSDANTERNIVVMEFDGSGIPTARRDYPTAGVCRPIYLLEDTEATPALIPAGEASIVVDIHGLAEYVDRRKRELETNHPGIRIRTFPLTERVAKAKESDGIPKALTKFLGEYKAKNGTPPSELSRLASERISWLRS